MSQLPPMRPFRAGILAWLLRVVNEGGSLRTVLDHRRRAAPSQPPFTEAELVAIFLAGATIFTRFQCHACCAPAAPRHSAGLHLAPCSAASGAIVHLNAQSPQITHRDVKPENLVLGPDATWKSAAACASGTAQVSCLGGSI
jgi:serine/threonine protein kinase